MENATRRVFMKQVSSTVVGVLAFPSVLRAQSRQTVDALNRDVPADKLIADLRTSIPDLMKRLNVPGLSIALIRDAKTFWAQGFGVKNAITREALTTDTPFEAASLSIPAFSYAVLKLCHHGKLSLDVPLGNYLPNYFPSSDDSGLKLITARMILSHTSGLRSRADDKLVTLSSTPGEKWSYSVLGYGYLQRVVERIVGEPLEAFMQTNLLRPLDMEDSSYDWNERYEKTAAKGHNEAGERVPGKNFYERYRGFSAEQKARLRNIQPEDAAPSAAFSLTSTPSDYARFLSEMIQPATKDRSDHKENLMTEILTAQVKVTEAIAWGLGWGLENTGAGDAFWHWGNAGTLQHFAIGYKKQGVGLVIMTNSSNGLRLCRELVPQVIGRSPEGFSLLLK